MTQIFALHRAAEAGDTRYLITLLATAGADAVNGFDTAGHTPLMVATTSPQAGVETMRALIECGAEVDAPSRDLFGAGISALSMALSGGDIAKVRALIEAGANLHYSRRGYGALIDAASRMRIPARDDDAALIRLLIDAGVRLDDITCYGESGLGLLSNAGRFDLVQLLLDAGANPAPLGWTSLHRAVALGCLADVNTALDQAADIEAKDAWKRTAFLLAIQTGDQDKVELLMLSGVNLEARGRCGKPPLFYAIDSGDQAMLDWLLGEGISPLQLDDFRHSALSHASQCGNLNAIRTLLKLGMDPDDNGVQLNALYLSEDAQVARALIEAGADPQQLQFEMRRALVGLPAEPSSRLFSATSEDVQRGAHRRFGRKNAERMDDPFWRAMIQSGLSAYAVGDCLEQRPPKGPGAVWSAQRFGQSITFLPDGRIIQVGGEHEDGYDPDFCIYNDVFVHYLDGRFEIYGYPEKVFPPTDFHTATRVGELIYLIGSLGYHGQRKHGTTAVYVLDTRSLQICRVSTSGDAPGWIYKHRAVHVQSGQIHVFGGFIETRDGGRAQARNIGRYALDLKDHVWIKQLDL